VLGFAAPWQVKEVKLKLPAWVEVILECQGDYHLTGPDGLRRNVHGWEERRWRYLDTMQLETVLIAVVPRLLDLQTGSTEIAVVPCAAKRARWAVLFESWAVHLLQAAPNVSRAAELLRLDWHSAWELRARTVARGLERRQAKPIATLGLDEKSFGRGQDYATVLTDPAVAGTRVRRGTLPGRGRGRVGGRSQAGATRRGAGGEHRHVAGIRRGNYGPAAASAHCLQSLPRRQPYERARGCGPPGGAPAAEANSMLSQQIESKVAQVIHE
jgi:hypothetical protein